MLSHPYNAYCPPPTPPLDTHTRRPVEYLPSPCAPLHPLVQRMYLAKDEYVTGAYGVEGRFPFLDKAVVQVSV